MNVKNVIWQTDEGDATTFEYEYLTEILFRNLIYSKYFDYKTYQTVLDNSIIVYSDNSNNISNDFRSYLNKFIDKGYNFYLIHLSNENLEHNTDYYDLANKVYRNYYDKSIVNKNVIYIPLGFKSGFYNLNIKDLNHIDNKIYDFCFIGQPKSDRMDMIDIIDKHNSYKHLTNGWNCSTSLSPDMCKNIYRQTRFAPCPMGYSHPDSFRFMEALESGAIPILKSYDGFDYHNKIFGNTPIPKIHSWDEMNNIQSIDKNEYIKLYHDIFNWYNNYKTNILTKII